MGPENRKRLTWAAAGAAALFAGWWAAPGWVTVDQCHDNAHGVDCTPLGWVLLWAWIALALLVVALLAVVLVLWSIAAWRWARARRARPG